MAKEMKDDGITLASVNKRVDDLAAMVKGINEKVDRHSVNHVNHVVKYHSRILDKGATKIGQVTLAALMALGVCWSAIGAEVVIDRKNVGTTGAFIVKYDKATGRYRLVVDRLIVTNDLVVVGVMTNSSPIVGDVTCDDINANGSSKTDRLGINLAAVTETTTTNGYGYINLVSLTASNRVADNLTMRLTFTANSDTTGTVAYATLEPGTADVTAASKDGLWYWRTFVAGKDKIMMSVNSNATGKIEVPVVLNLDRPVEFVSGSISNTALAAGSVGGSEYIAGSISNVAIAASAAIAASKLGFDPVVSKTGNDMNVWIGESVNTAAGTQTVTFTSGGYSVTNDMFPSGSYISVLPTTVTNHAISWTLLTTNTARYKAEPGETIKVMIVGR